MLCTFCAGIRLTDLVAFEIERYDEETCQLLNTENAYHHQPNFEDLCKSSVDGCQLCLLISQVLEADESWNADEKLYGSVQGENEHDLLRRLRSKSSSRIYIYRIDETERQDDAGIFEIAVVPTFKYDLIESSRSSASPHAFFWRALEVWPTTGKRFVSRYE